jgi:hypothetical protein
MAGTCADGALVRTVCLGPLSGGNSAVWFFSCGSSSRSMNGPLVVEATGSIAHSITQGGR